MARVLDDSLGLVTDTVAQWTIFVHADGHNAV
jgi:hypothetical protein